MIRYGLIRAANVLGDFDVTLILAIWMLQRGEYGAGNILRLALCG